MRNATLASLTLATLLAIQFQCLAQEATAPEKAPLQIVDESLRAIEAGDFATYVDHLSAEEQKVQAGFALLMWATVSPSMDEAFERFEPQELLLLRALNDVVIEHSALTAGEGESPTAQAMRLAAKIQGLLSGAAEASAGYSSSGYATSQAAGPTRVYDLLQKTAGMLKDPREFLIVVLTELSRPTYIDGALSKNPESLGLTEMVKAYREQKWSLYVRGNYAVAAPADVPPQIPAKDEADASRASEPSATDSLRRPPEFDPYQAPPSSPPYQPISAAPRIEFQKIGGAWKISHVAPISGLAGLSGMTTQACVGGNCAPAGYVSPTPPSLLTPPTSSP